MSSFVRFIFTIVIVGMAVNLAVVLVANVRSERRQKAQYQRDAGLFHEMVEDVAGHVRRADIIVESQRLDARDTALESTLLVRQYRSRGTSQKDPLPVVRITIPGNKLQVTGLLLEFDSLFAGDRPEYEVLRNKQFVLFGTFGGADETAATRPGAAGESYSFVVRDQVPELLRLHPQAPQPSVFESGLWRRLWEVIPVVPRDARPPLAASRPDLGVKATWLEPVTIYVRRTLTYTAYISTSMRPDGQTSGELTLGQDLPGMSDLMRVMEEEGKRLPR
jgi:hypothetical protein